MTTEPIVLKLTHTGYEFKSKKAARGVFSEMDDRQLRGYIEEWADFAPESFWQDGELDMSRRDAIKHYMREWRRMPTRWQYDQKRMIDAYHLGGGRRTWAAERVAARYIRRTR